MNAHDSSAPAPGSVLPLAHHPIADRFPLLNGARFQELVRDLQDHGLREPITLYEGKILDDRNRYRACRQLGIELQTRALPEGLDPWAYVWSLNGQRRDLSADQRYLICKRVTEGSADWQTEQERRRAEANRKRAQATKAQPRTEDGSRLAPKSGPNTTGVDTSRTASEFNPAAAARAASSQTNRGPVQRGDFLDAKRPDLAEQVIQGQTAMAAAIREARREEHARRLTKMSKNTLDRGGGANGCTGLPKGPSECVTAHHSTSPCCRKVLPIRPANLASCLWT